MYLSLGFLFVALSTMAIFGSYSTFFVLNQIYLQIPAGLLVAAGMFFVGRIKVCEKQKPHSAK